MAAQRGGQPRGLKRLRKLLSSPVSAWRQRHKEDDLEANQPIPERQQSSSLSTPTVTEDLSEPHPISRPQPSAATITTTALVSALGPTSSSTGILSPLPASPAKFNTSTSTASTAPTTQAGNSIFSVANQIQTTQNSQSSTSSDPFVACDEEETWVSEIGKYTSTCKETSSALREESKSILQDLALELKNIEGLCGRNIAFAIQPLLARSKSEQKRSLLLLIPCGSKEDKAMIERSWEAHQPTKHYLKKHGGTLEVFVRDGTSRLHYLSSLDLCNITTTNIPASGRLLIPKGRRQFNALRIEVRSTAGTFMCYCTLGGFVVVSGHVFGWTTEHCLRSNETQDLPTSLQSTDWPPARDDSRDSELELYDFYPVEFARPPAVDNIESREGGFSYDWMLVNVSKVPASVLRPCMQMTEKNPFLSILPERMDPVEPVRILLQDSSEVCGNLSLFPAVITMGPKLHSVQVIELSKALPPGSSGAWVSYNSHLCGFIIAMQKSPTWAYMIPMRDAFMDFKAVMGEVPRIATADHLDRMPQSISQQDQMGVDVSSKLNPAMASKLTHKLQKSSASTTTTTTANTSAVSNGKTSARPKTGLRHFLARLKSIRPHISPLEERCAFNHPTSSKPKTLSHRRSGQLLLVDNATVDEGTTGAEEVDTTPTPSANLALRSTDEQDSAAAGSLPFLGNTARPREHRVQGQLKLPRKVICKLLININGKRIERREEYMFKWLAHKTTFRELTSTVEVLLRNNGLSALAKAYIRLGNCSLWTYRTSSGKRSVSPGQLFGCTTVENEAQWTKNVPRLVLGFWAANQGSPFCLELRWDVIQLNFDLQDSRNFLEYLPSLLENNRQWNWENRGYIPQKALRNIMSPEMISEVVQSYRLLHNVGRGDFQQYLSHNAWRLMAATVSAGLPLKLLSQLWESGIDDTNLPLNSTMCPEGILAPDFETLLSRQYEFTTFNFDDASCARPYRVLDPEIVVPLTFDKNKDRLGQGQGYGEVFRVEIHPEHHTLGRHGAQFVVKRFARRPLAVDDKFGPEHRILSNLSLVRHNHLLAPVTSWQQRDYLYLLFPRARSNLQSFLLETPPPNLTRDAVLWFLAEIKALADAVRLIHNLGPAGLGHVEASKPSRTVASNMTQCFHHDLRPANILVFTKTGTSTSIFMIADLGLARISQTFSGSLPYHDEAYSAPDADPSRPYDIFSLGCIFLEISLWVLGTATSLDEFAGKRRKVNGSDAYWYRAEEKASLKPSVIEVLEDLQGLTEGRGVFSDLLQLMCRMLTPEPKRRPAAAIVVNDLDAILLQASIDLRDDEVYLADRSTSRQLAAPPSQHHRGTLRYLGWPDLDAERTGNIRTGANMHNSTDITPQTSHSFPALSAWNTVHPTLEDVRTKNRGTSAGLHEGSQSYYTASESGLVLAPLEDRTSAQDLEQDGHITSNHEYYLTGVASKQVDDTDQMFISSRDLEEDAHIDSVMEDDHPRVAYRTSTCSQCSDGIFTSTGNSKRTSTSSVATTSPPGRFAQLERQATLKTQEQFWKFANFTNITNISNRLRV